jgi:hypothetical protein
MIKATNSKSLILLAVGMLVIASSQVISHFIPVPDVLSGSIIGFGIGLVLIPILFGDLKTYQ